MSENYGDPNVPKLVGTSYYLVRTNEYHVLTRQITCAHKIKINHIWGL